MMNSPNLLCRYSKFIVLFRHYPFNPTFAIRKQTRNQRGKKGEKSLVPFFRKLEKKCPNFWGKYPDCGHLWLTFLFTVQFLRISRRKNRKFFSAAPFFFVLQMIVYRSALIPKNFLSLKKFLVARLEGRQIAGSIRTKGKYPLFFTEMVYNYYISNLKMTL